MITRTINRLTLLPADRGFASLLALSLTLMVSPAGSAEPVEAAMTPYRVSGTTGSTALVGSTDPSTLAPMIVGGEDAAIQEVPWQIALMDNTRGQFCGGSILSARWILTAAHCLDDSGFSLDHVRAGVTDKTDTSGQDVAVLRQILHPDWTAPIDHDFALIELAEALDLSGPKAKAIPIMTARLAETGLQNPGVLAMTTGWGALSEGGPGTNILQKVLLPIVSNEDATTLGSYDPTDLTAAMIAAGYLGVGGQDACQGDSGGPLVVPHTGSPVGFRLAGVTSWGEGCARDAYPGIWARVSHVDTWILQTISQSAAPIPALAGWGVLVLTGLLGVLGAMHRTRWGAIGRVRR